MSSENSMGSRLRLPLILRIGTDSKIVLRIVPVIDGGVLGLRTVFIGV
jgi:hypothetical protein